jgi:DNA-binding ferritin-like protein
VIDEVLGDSIHLRDLYRNARWQNGDIEFYRLRQLFDNHYREQLCLVDLLVDRMRVLGGAGSLFAHEFLRKVHFSRQLRGEGAAYRLLQEFFEAHESVLANTRPTGSAADQHQIHQVVAVLLRDSVMLCRALG